MRKHLYLVIEICHDDIKTVCINYSSKSFPADTLFFGFKKVQQYIVLKYYLYVLCLQNNMYLLKCCNTTVFFCFIFIFMTTLISSKPISNICRACKLSNLAQQLGEGGGGRGMHDCYFKPSPKHKTRWGAPKHMYPLPFFPKQNFTVKPPATPPPPPRNVFYKKLIVA